MTNPVLLVEDDPTLQMLGARQFQILGVGLDIATCGASAIEKVKTNTYELVLMDLGMPDMSGIEAAMHIREFEQKNGRKRVLIVAMTAFSEREQALAVGMDDFIQKPVLLDALAAVVRKWAPAIKILRK